MGSSKDDVSRIKAGASLLAKGGTLSSEPCSKCNGVQVRFKDKITCINCGNEVNLIAAQSAGERGEATTTTPRKPAATSAAAIIEEKIAILASELRGEDDIFLQREKAEMLERYIGILEKIERLIP